MRDLSDIYKYAHDAEKGGTENVYSSEKSTLDERANNERKALLERTKLNRKKYLPKRSNKAGMIIVAVILLILIVTAAVIFIPKLIAPTDGGSSETVVSDSIPADDANIPSEPETEAATEAPAAVQTEVTATVTEQTTPPPADTIETESTTPTEEITAEVEPTEETDPEFIAESYHGYSVGDIVKYNGTVHYSSSYSNELKGACRGGLAMISGINPEGLHPFHLVAVDSTGNVYGWVDEAFITAE